MEQQTRPYNGILLQHRPLQVALLPELCSHRQRHLEERGQTTSNTHSPDV